MTKLEAKKRIEKLKKVINYHRYLYHVLNKQKISDAALDSLKHELYKLEEQFPEFVTPDSPTQRVAGKPLEGFIKVKHKVPMLSIEDIFFEKELKDWQGYLKRLVPLQKLDFFVELKVDGFAVALIYKKGLLSRGATRGSGRIGEDGAETADETGGERGVEEVSPKILKMVLSASLIGITLSDFESTSTSLGLGSGKVGCFSSS